MKYKLKGALWALFIIPITTLAEQQLEVFSQAHRPVALASFEQTQISHHLGGTFIAKRIVPAERLYSADKSHAGLLSEIQTILCQEPASPHSLGAFYNEVPSFDDRLLREGSMQVTAGPAISIQEEVRPITVPLCR